MKKAQCAYFIEFRYPIATVMLLEPVVGALLGVAAGTAAMPGLQVWLGDLVVAGGTFMVIYAGASKKETIDATEALRTRVDAVPLGGDDLESRTSLLKSPLIPRVSAKTYDPKEQDASGDKESTAKVLWTT